MKEIDKFIQGVQKELESPPEFFQSDHCFDFSQRVLLYQIFKEIKPTMRRERNIFEDVLFDFLRELPEGFDRNTTTVAEAYKIIEKFLIKHGLNDEDATERPSTQPD